MDSSGSESQGEAHRAYVLKTIADILVSAELEKRIVELEEKHEQRMHQTGFSIDLQNGQHSHVLPATGSRGPSRSNCASLSGGSGSENKKPCTMSQL